MCCLELVPLKPWPNDCNISTQHSATLLGATCCERLATLLRRVATCWVLLAQIWKWSNFSWRLHDAVVIWPGLWQCCAWACALARFFNSNMWQHVATGWPNAWHMLRPTMLRSVAFKCCYCLAGALYRWKKFTSSITPTKQDLDISVVQGFLWKFLTSTPLFSYGRPPGILNTKKTVS